MHHIKEFKFRHISALDSLFERALEECMNMLPEDTREFIITVDQKTFDNLKKEIEDQEVIYLSENPEPKVENVIKGLGMHGIKYTIQIK